MPKTPTASNPDNNPVDSAAKANAEANRKIISKPTANAAANPAAAGSVADRNNPVSSPATSKPPPSPIQTNNPTINKRAARTPTPSNPAQDAELVAAADGQGRGGQPGNQPGQPQDGQQPANPQVAQPPGQPNQQPNRNPNARGGPGNGQFAGGPGSNATPPLPIPPPAPANTLPPDGTPLAAAPDTREPTTQPAPGRMAGPYNTSGNNGPDLVKPITGEGFREWSDRMRDVEEMVGDPRIAAQAAAIRQRVAAIRADTKQNGLPPNWQTVEQTVAAPLAELRSAINNELLQRESTQAQVPIDSEPVPPAYQDQVRRYYERLGSGK